MVLSAILVASGCFLVVLAMYSNKTYRYLAPIAFLLHLFVGLVLLPELPYRWDFSNFHNAAVLLLDGSLPDTSSKVAAFGAFQAILYYVFRPSLDVLVAFNSLLAVLIPIPARYLAQQLYSRTVWSRPPKMNLQAQPNVPTSGVIAIILFAPTPFLFMTLPMRDTLSVLLLFTILAFIVLAFSKHHIWPLTLATPLFGMLSLIRPELGAVLVLGIGATALIHIVNKILSHNISFPTLAAILSPIGVAGFVLFTNMYPVTQLETMRDWRAQGGASYLDWMSYDSWIDVILVAPVRAIYFQYAPFPTQIESIFHFLGMLDLPLYILLTIAAYRSFLRCQLDQRIFALLLTVYLAGVVGYGLINSNFGTAVRHRVPFEYLLVVFATPVIAHWEASLAEWRRQWPRYYRDYKKHRNKP